MSQLDLTAATAAVLDHRWGDDTGQTPWRAHNRHNFNSDCAVCRGDVAAMLAVALPHLREQIAREERAKAASELRDELADEIEERVDKCSGCNNWADAIAIVRGEVTP